jgi:hypothetical protein
VATPVAGFRELDPPITVATRVTFTDTVLHRLDGAPTPPGPGTIHGEPETWTTLATTFLAVLDAAASAPPGH